jgi:hypothetical protein
VAAYRDETRPASRHAKGVLVLKFAGSMKAASLVGAAAFVVILAALLFSASPQVSFGVAALGGIVVGLAQLLVTRSQTAISQEQLSLMERQEQRDLERAAHEMPDLKARVEFRVKSELQPRGIHADGRYNALVTLENHGMGAAEKVSVTASRQQGEPLIRPLGVLKGGETKYIALPLELGPSIEATAATIGRSIVIKYEGASSPIVFKMTQTHPPAWDVETPPA